MVKFLKASAVCVLSFFIFCGGVQSAVKYSGWAESAINEAIYLELIPADAQRDYTENITKSEFADLMAGLALVLEPEKSIDPLLSGNDSITRQQAAAILFKAADTLTPLISETYKNSAQIEGFAPWHMPHNFNDGALLRLQNRKAVNWCYRYGIMSGDSANNFNPDAFITFEQSCAAVLNLYNLIVGSDEINANTDYYPVVAPGNREPVSVWYDSSLTRHTVEELGYISDPDSAYGFIIDSVGPGIASGYIINRKGERQFTELSESDGSFYSADFYGDFITVTQRYSHKKFLINTKTREINELRFIPYLSPEPKFYRYEVLSEDGKAISEWTEPSPFIGTELPNGSQIKFTSGVGFYGIFSTDGKQISETYKNGLRHIDGNLFMGWAADYPPSCDILYCDGILEAKKVSTEAFGLNDGVCFLGGGVYAAAQNTKRQIIVFDGFGETVCVIKTGYDCYLPQSSNGLIVAADYSNGSLHYYTQFGAELPMTE